MTKQNSKTPFFIIIMNYLNKALKTIRDFHGISQIELSQKSGLSQSYISELEKGIKTPSIEVLEKYSEVFNMPTYAFLKFSDSLQNKDPKNKSHKVALKISKLLEWINKND